MYSDVSCPRRHIHTISDTGIRQVRNSVPTTDSHASVAGIDGLCTCIAAKNSPIP